MKRGALAGRCVRSGRAGLLLVALMVMPVALSANSVGRFASVLRPLTVWVDLVIAASGPVALLGLIGAAGMYMASDDDRGFKKGIRVSVSAFAIAGIVSLAGIFGLSGAVVG